MAATMLAVEMLQLSSSATSVSAACRNSKLEKASSPGPKSMTYLRNSWKNGAGNVRGGSAKVVVKKRSMVISAATLPVLTFNGAKAGEAEMDLRTAKPETAGAVVHRGVITELQNRRRGTASTLTRGEVRGGGRKPYKQKGTGQARRGSQRTPLRPGGGVVFGPKPVDWRIKINRKEKRLAISTALQSAAIDAVVVQDLNESLSTPKTKDFLSALSSWGVETSKQSLIFTTDVSKNLSLSSRNVKTVKLLTPRSLNLYDILNANQLVLTQQGLDYLNETYGNVEQEFEEGEGEGDDGEESIDV